MGRTLLLVKKEAVHSFGISFQGDWPVFKMRQQYGRDSDVVVDDVTFLEAGFRVKNLLEVRHVDDSPFHIEPRCCGHITMTSRERSRLCLRADVCLREIAVSVMARTISTLQPPINPASESSSFCPAACYRGWGSVSAGRRIGVSASGKTAFRHGYNDREVSSRGSTPRAKAGAFAYADPGMSPGVTKKEHWKKTQLGLPMTCYMVCLSN
jgi:hypothetical protein